MITANLFGDEYPRVLSLTQPWASAVARGLKLIETRSWSTPHRGPMLIHAAKGFPEAAQVFAAERELADEIPDTLPFGSVICLVDLVDVKRTEKIRDTISQRERSYGDYRDGRYGWIMQNIRTFEPIPFRGAQGLRWAPDELLAAVDAALGDGCARRRLTR